MRSTLHVTCLLGCSLCWLAGARGSSPSTTTGNNVGAEKEVSKVNTSTDEEIAEGNKGGFFSLLDITDDTGVEDEALTGGIDEQLIKTLVEAEIVTYKGMTQQPFKTCNPLKWWKSNEQNLPKLAALARKLLSIPATSAPSERVWSIAARILVKN